MAANSQSQDEHARALRHSATLHARLLETELRYLHDSGTTPPLGSKESTDLQAALSSLLKFIPPQPPKQGPPQESSTNPSTQTSISNRHILAIPEVCHLNEQYFSIDSRSLIANAGDAITVHAWIDDNAIAHNPENQTAGRVPKFCLNETGTKAAAQPDVAVMLGSSSLRGKVHWQVGDRMRICQYDSERKSRGVALNLRTLQIGRYECVSDRMRLLKIEETRGDALDYPPPAYYPSTSTVAQEGGLAIVPVAEALDRTLEENNQDSISEVPDSPDHAAPPRMRMRTAVSDNRNTATAAAQQASSSNQQIDILNAQILGWASLGC